MNDVVSVPLDAPIELQSSNWIKVGTLRPEDDVDVQVKIYKAREIISLKKPDDSTLRMCEALVGDETASIIFTAYDDEVDLIQPDATLDIINGYVEVVSGYMRLVSGRWGKVRSSTSAPSISSINISNNLSDMEYELIDE